MNSASRIFRSRYSLNWMPTAHKHVKSLRMTICFIRAAHYFIWKKQTNNKLIKLNSSVFCVRVRRETTAGNSSRRCSRHRNSSKLKHNLSFFIFNMIFVFIMTRGSMKSENKLRARPMDGSNVMIRYETDATNLSPRRMKRRKFVVRTRNDDDVIWHSKNINFNRRHVRISLRISYFQQW